MVLDRTWSKNVNTSTIKANSISIVNLGRDITYRGKFKGWRHQESDWHIKLIRSNGKTSLHRTGKNASATLRTHLQNTDLECVFSEKKLGCGLFAEQVKIAGFGGKHTIGYVAKRGKDSYHIERSDDHIFEIAARAIGGLNRKIELAIERKAKADTDKLAVANGEKFTAEQVAKQFGFCSVGIRQFMDSVGLKITEAYDFYAIEVACFNRQYDGGFANVCERFSAELNAFWQANTGKDCPYAIF